MRLFFSKYFLERLKHFLAPKLLVTIRRSSHLSFDFPVKFVESKKKNCFNQKKNQIRSIMQHDPSFQIRPTDKVVKKSKLQISKTDSSKLNRAFDSILVYGPFNRSLKIN